MADTFYIKRNDTAPAFRATLQDADAASVDVTGATVRFHMRNEAGVAVVDAAAVIITAASGIVEYRWAAADTATSGVYKAEFEVTYSTGYIETFPNSGYHKVKIIDDIA
jgi:predicted dehydrogenase